jgi:hypothetical protein
MRKLAVPAVFLSVAALGMIAGPAALAGTPAGVTRIPNTLTTCASNGNGRVCFEINGSGNFVRFMQVTMSWNARHTTTHLRIYYTPTGSPSWNSPTGVNVASFTKTLNRNENSGQWCGAAYIGSTFAGQSCVIND